MSISYPVFNGGNADQAAGVGAKRNAVALACSKLQHDCLHTLCRLGREVVGVAQAAQGLQAREDIAYKVLGIFHERAVVAGAVLFANKKRGEEEEEVEERRLGRKQDWSVEDRVWNVQ